MSVHSLSDLTETLRNFASRRNWEHFHTPKNLAMALVAEAGELAAEFQWLTAEESQQVRDNSESLARVRQEMADVLIYLVRLADVLEVDLLSAAEEKTAVNEERFPVHQ